MVHRRPEYFASVRFYSSRTVSSRCVNEENKLGEHLADGCFHFVSGNAAEFANVFPVMDWRRIGGTTVEQNQPLTPCTYNDLAQNHTSFVGGVSDSQVGTAAMHLASRNLSAHKAWFFFDHAIVCLGADVKLARGSNPVFTSIMQQNLLSEVTAAEQGLPASVVPAGSTREYDKLSWLHHNGVGTLVASGQAVVLNTVKRSGNWLNIGVSNGAVTENIIDVYIDHRGRSQYSYVMLPNVTVSEMPGLATTNAGLDVLANTPQLQAVQHKATNLLQAVFWVAGNLSNVAPAGWRFSADRACLIVVRADGNRLEVSASNPDQTVRVPFTLTLQVDRAGLVGSACTAANGATLIRLLVPAGGDTQGATVKATCTGS
jgi:chondroitin AC lyase